MSSQTSQSKKTRRPRPVGFRNEHPINRCERELAQAQIAGDTEAVTRLTAEYQRLMAPAAPFLAGGVVINGVEISVTNDGEEGWEDE